MIKELRKNLKAGKLVFGAIIITILLLMVSLSSFMMIVSGADTIVTVSSNMTSFDATSNCIERKIVRMSNQNLICAYHSGTSSIIYIARSTNNGSSWSESSVISLGTGAVYGCSLAVDGNDKLYLVYDNDGGATNYIYMQNSTNYGATWGTQFVLNSGSGSSYNCYEPAVAIGQSNKVHVVWYEEQGSDNTYHAVYVNSSNWFEQYDLNPSNSSKGVSICIDNSNYVHVAYGAGASSSIPPLIIYHRRYTTSWQTGTYISQHGLGAGKYQANPSIVCDGQNVYVGWQGRPSATSIYEAWFAKSTDYGTSFTYPPSQITSSSTYDNEGVTISVDKTHDIHLAWYSKYDATNYLIKYTNSTNVGTTWRTVTSITSANNDQKANFIWANYPVIGGEGTNRPATGYALIFTRKTSSSYYVTYYINESITWNISIAPPTEWSSNFNLLGETGGLITWSGYAGNTPWSNEELQIVLNVNSTDTVSEIRVRMGAINTTAGPREFINASNMLIQFRTPSASYGSTTRQFSDSILGVNITIDATQWTNPNGCYGTNPFPITDTNTSIYFRVKLNIPALAVAGTYKSFNSSSYRIYIGQT